jgi:AcrR family transcriptional regulator
MNKNDLRFQKTELAIKNAYLSLKKQGTTIVRVKELCEAAMINKTTFYAHYETIEHLHKQVCKEFVTELLGQCEYVENTRDFVDSVLGVFTGNLPTIERLYGEDLHALVNDAESVLMELFIKESVDDDFELSVRFCIGGAFRLLVM